MAWAVPCGPLMLYSIYQACTVVWVCADICCCTSLLRVDSPGTAV